MTRKDVSGRVISGEKIILMNSFMPKKVFWPVTLVIMGLIFMASNMGYLPKAFWNFSKFLLNDNTSGINSFSLSKEIISVITLLRPSIYN